MPAQKTTPPAPVATTIAPTPKPIVAMPAPSKDLGYAPGPFVEDLAPATNKRTGVWTEAFAERESRPSSHIDTAGIIVGYDRQFKWDGASVRLGGIGSFTDIRAASSSNDVTLTLFEPFNPRDITSTLTFSDTPPSTSRIKTSGVGAGVTWSIARNNAFLDGIAKLDFFELNNASSSALIAQDPNFPDVQIYDGKGPISELRIYQADGTFTAYADNTSFQSAAAGCVIAGTDQTDPLTKIQDKINQLFSPTPTSRNASASLAIMTLANNYGVTYDLGHGTTFVPSVGFRYTYSHYYNDDPSLQLRDGQVLRLEAGGKLTHLHQIGRGATWSNTVGLYAYSDVWVDGFVISAGGSSFKGDQGEVRLRGMLQSKLQFADGLQLYGELNGRVGYDYHAVGGKLGVRLEW